VKARRDILGIVEISMGWDGQSQAASGSRALENIFLFQLVMPEVNEKIRINKAAQRERCCSN
jgi:hypothetical protein